MRRFAFRALGSAIFLAGVFLILEGGRESSDALKAVSPDSKPGIVTEPNQPERVMHFDAAANLEPQLDSPVAASQEVHAVATNSMPTPARPGTTELPRRNPSVLATLVPMSQRFLIANPPEDFSSDDGPSNGTVILVDDLEVEIPSGQQLPVAVLASARNDAGPDGLNEQQKELAERVTADFANDLSAKSAPTGSETLRASLSTLQSAANLADERFRALFGHDIYNREIVRQHQLGN